MHVRCISRILRGHLRLGASPPPRRTQALRCSPFMNAVYLYIPPPCYPITHALAAALDLLYHAPPHRPSLSGLLISSSSQPTFSCLPLAWISLSSLLSVILSLSPLNHNSKTCIMCMAYIYIMCMCMYAYMHAVHVCVLCHAFETIHAFHARLCPRLCPVCLCSFSFKPSSYLSTMHLAHKDICKTVPMPFPHFPYICDHS